MSKVWFGGVLWLLCACASRLAYPYSTQELARDVRDNPKRALVHYLGQRNADPEVCRISGAGGGIARIDSRVLVAVAVAMTEGDLRAEPAGRCMLIAIDGLPRADARTALARIGELQLEQLTDDARSDSREELHRLLVQSTTARDDAEALEPLERDLSAALAEGSMAPAARPRTTPTSSVSRRRSSSACSQPASTRSIRKRIASSRVASRRGGARCTLW